MISPTITAELVSLQNQVAAASPLSSADNATIEALQLNSIQLVNDLQAALTAGSILDTWTASVDPQNMVDGVLSVSVEANDKNQLALDRGLLGRVAANLNQIAAAP